MRKALFSFLLMCIYLGISSCGTTGPLYIPEQRYPQEAPVDAPKDKNSTDKQSTQ